MTNSTHRHKWTFVKNVYRGYAYCGNLTARGIYKCKCGKLKYGKAAPGGDVDWY